MAALVVDSSDLMLRPSAIGIPTPHIPFKALQIEDIDVEHRPYSLAHVGARPSSTLFKMATEALCERQNVKARARLLSSSEIRRHQNAILATVRQAVLVIFSAI
jgi:hypothetical protein